jgi:hypothetical protein
VPVQSLIHLRRIAAQVVHLRWLRTRSLGHPSPNQLRTLRVYAGNSVNQVQTGAKLGTNFKQTVCKPNVNFVINKANSVKPFVNIV